MNLTFEERVRGVVFGTAYGDALGATIEKLSYSEIKNMYVRVESIDNPWYKANFDKDKRNNRMRGFGIITDDTLMTLALMNVYIIEKRHIDAYDLSNEFIKGNSF